MNVEQAKIPETPTPGVNSVTVRLLAGGEYTNPALVVDPDRLPTLLMDIFEGRTQVDNQPIIQLSTKERDKHWKDKGKSEDEAFNEWAGGMIDWINESATLEQPNRELYEDRRSILAGFGITLEEFTRLSRQDQLNKMDQLLDTLQTNKGETDVERIRDIFHNSARMTDDPNSLSMFILRRRLEAMDEFLNSCGYEAKQAVREAILGQGFIHTNQQEQTQFIATASTVVNTISLEENHVLSRVYQEYRDLHQENEEPIYTPTITQEEPQFYRDPNPTLAISAEELDAIRTRLAAHPQEPQDTTPTDEIPIYPPHASPVPLLVPKETPETQTERELQPSPVTEHEGEQKQPEVVTSSETEHSIVGPVGVAERIHPPTLHELSGDLAVSEDNKVNDPKNGLFAVFDGVGGNAAGEYASELAANEVASSELAILPDTTPVETVEQVMRNVILKAHQTISSQESRKMARVKEWRKYSANKDKSDQEIKEMVEERGLWSTMGTTATIAKMLHDGTVVIGSIGDSRAYVLRGDRQVDALEEMTLDHGFSDPEMKSKFFAIQRKLSNAEKADDLESGEQFRFLHRSGLDSALGLDEEKNPLFINIERTKLAVGDVLLLTTDGIHDNLTDRELEAILRKHPNDAQGAADEILAKAYERSQDKAHYRHKEDDMTVLVIPRKR